MCEAGQNPISYVAYLEKSSNKNKIYYIFNKSCYVWTTQYINWRPSDLTDSWMGLSITYYLARLGSL